MWDVLVEEWPDAAPVQGLAAALRHCEYEVFTNRDRGARQAAEGGHSILRVTPHENDDSCGHQGTHAEYSVTWSMPMFCDLPQTHLAAPPCKTPDACAELALTA